MQFHTLDGGLHLDGGSPPPCVLCCVPDTVINGNKERAGTGATGTWYIFHCWDVWEEGWMSRDGCVGGGLKVLEREVHQ